MTLSSSDDTVLLAIRDGSTSIPVTVVPQATDIRGRGLLLVEQLSREWGTSTDGAGSKSVWASFTTRTRPRPA